MKTAQKLFLVALYTTFSITQPMQLQLTPTNTIIVSDLDDVLIQKSLLHKINLIAGGAWKDPFNTIIYLQALNRLRSTYTKDADGGKNTLQDHYGNKINGLTFQFLYHGTQDENLTPYVPWIINTMEQSRSYIDGTKKTYEYITAKGYTFVLATNKDRTSFDIVNEQLNLSSLTNKTFVAHPGNTDQFLKQLHTFAKQSSAPTEYKELLAQTLAIQPSETIHHVPCCKPSINYYHQVQAEIGTNKHMIFIDDKKANTASFKHLPSSPQEQRLAIHFKDPAQLANKFVKLGILSEEEDKKFLEEIRYPGISGKIQLYTKKLIDVLYH
jgi:FMN phosphatase YigB (HAD superfamily)